MYHCALCLKELASVKELDGHISVEHLRWLPYECVYCSTFKPTKHEMAAHVAALHADKDCKMVVALDADKKRQLKLIRASSTRQAPVTTPIAPSMTPTDDSEVMSPSLTTSAADYEPSPKRRRPAADSSLDEASDVLSRLFDASPSAARRNTSSQRRVDCAVCGQRTRKNCQDHVWAAHLKASPFECGRCGKPSRRRNKVEEHWQRCHPGDPSEIVDRRDEYAEQLGRLRLLCYPPTPSAPAVTARVKNERPLSRIVFNGADRESEDVLPNTVMSS